MYEDEESLIRLQEVMKFPQTYEGVQITFKQLDSLSDDYRPMLKEIRKSGESKIVLDCTFEKIAEVLRQANEIEMINDYHSYIITSLDLERIDLSPYKNEGVNITGYRMVDTSTPQVAHYLKKWNWNVGSGDGRGASHPLYVRSNTIIVMNLYFNLLY